MSCSYEMNNKQNPAIQLKDYLTMIPACFFSPSGRFVGGLESGSVSIGLDGPPSLVRMKLACLSCCLRLSRICSCSASQDSIAALSTLVNNVRSYPSLTKGGGESRGDRNRSKSGMAMWLYSGVEWCLKNRCKNEV